jgi:hypothetical protein
LSSTVSKVAKEVIFVKQVVDSMGYKISFPIMIRVDNVGAIYLATNHTTSQRTKHINIRQHFGHEFIEDGILKCIFVKSEDNDAYIFKKKTNKLFHEHAKKNVKRLKKITTPEQ